MNRPIQTTSWPAFSAVAAAWMLDTVSLRPPAVIGHANQSAVFPAPGGPYSSVTRPRGIPFGASASSCCPWSSLSRRSRPNSIGAGESSLFRKRAWDAETVGSRSEVVLELPRGSGGMDDTDEPRQEQGQLFALHGLHEPLAIEATGLAGTGRSSARCVCCMIPP